MGRIPTPSVIELDQHFKVVDGKLHIVIDLDAPGSMARRTRGALRIAARRAEELVALQEERLKLVKLFEAALSLAGL